MSGVGAAVLPVLSGLLLAVSFPPFPLTPVVFLGIVPLLLYIAERPAGARGRWEATRGGIITGVVYFGVQLYWMATALLRYSLLAIPAYLGAVLVLAGLAGGFAWAVHLTRDRLRLPLPVAAAVFWTSMEWVQGHLGDLAFPWLGLGTALAPVPMLAGAADLVGALGLTLWIATINGLLASALLLHRAGRPTAPALLMALAVFTGPVGYGVLRAESLRMHPAATVAVVQPNIPEDIKLGPAALDSSLTALTRLTRTLEGEPLDLVAWPEIALPADFLRSEALRDSVRALSAALGAPIVVGAYGVDDAGDPMTYNSAFLVDSRPGAGLALPRYDKQRLVPFVERVPFLDPALLTGGGTARRFGTLERGRGRPVLGSGSSNSGSFGVLICYESIFADVSTGYRAGGSDFLVNITNDAWYGRSEWWGRTTALWQHPAHLVLRAIETRSGVARAANTGISMFVDPLGRTYQETELFEPAVRVAVVYTTDTIPLFVRWGDWVGKGAVLLGLLLLVSGSAAAPTSAPEPVDRRGAVAAHLPR